MKRVIIFVILAAAVLVGLVVLRGRGIETKIEPTSVSPGDKAAMVAAVYRARRTTNELSVYYVERYTRGKASWYHVLFNDEG